MKFVKGHISDKAGRKIEGIAKSERRSFKAQCMILLEWIADNAHILEQHADNGIYRALHPVKKK